jgi:tetratricopeptide (TPR) repeat protein
MDNELYKAEMLFNEGSTNESLEVIDKVIKKSPTVAEYLMLRAKIYYRLQKWGDALNDLNLILDKEPGNQMAINYKSMVIYIINFWNKDNFNP